MRTPLFPSLFHRFESLPEVFEERVQFFPEREAVVSDQVRLSFRQLEEKVSRFAVYLRDNNVRQGDWAAIILPNCSEFVISFLALAKIGAVIVPVDTYFGTQELKNLFDIIPVTTCITNPAFLPIVQSILIEKPKFVNLILDQTCREGDPNTVEPGNETISTNITWPKLRPRTPFLYLYTSGTTGPPKGILLDHDRVMRISIGWRNRLPLIGDEKCYNLAPLFRSPALFSVIGAGIYYGITMIIPTEFRPEKVWDEIASERACLFHANPYHFGILAKLTQPNKRETETVRLCYATGNRLSLQTKRIFLETFGLAIESRYGTSETGGICRDGVPLSNVRIRLIDQAGKEIKTVNRTGEIIVRTPTMIKEYRNLPHCSKQTFRNGWFRTGDRGKFDASGCLRILSRIKTAVTVAGRTVYADDIERILRSHKAVREVMVIRKQNAVEVENLTAVVVLHSPADPDFMRFCTESPLLRNMPCLIEIKDELPKNWKNAQDDQLQNFPEWGKY